MLGELSTDQVEDLLKSQAIGRIGCHSDGITYIVPINYVYDGTFVYGHSAKGQKIDMMRKNPEICFQVDAIQNVVNWQSVIAWGKFEEIIDLHEKEQVMKKLINKIIPLITSETGHPSHGITENESDIGDGIELILYKIALNRKTGRFEKR
jgi:nitroimidazol reductase NimA-like FMN-containing flavoprotein (pyridoxamine 5'-phosphate oxidase superfamily)